MDLLKFVYWILESKNEHQINKADILKYLNENIFPADNPAKSYLDARVRVKKFLSLL